MELKLGTEEQFSMKSISEDCYYCIHYQLLFPKFLILLRLYNAIMTEPNSFSLQKTRVITVKKELPIIKEGEGTQRTKLDLEEAKL